MGVTQLNSRLIKDGTVDTADLKDGSVTRAKLADAVKPALSHRNRIINGGFRFWQRGTTFAVSTGTYGADRWFFKKDNTPGVFTMTQDTTVVPDGRDVASMRLNVTTADATVGATEDAYLAQNIEGYVFRPLRGQTMTLSFYVRSSKTGIYCVAFRNSAGTRSYVAEYTVIAANTWEQKTITLTHDETGTWNYDTNNGLIVSWALMVGTNLQTATGGGTGWLAGNLLATANQVNFLDSTSNTFYLARVQLEAGDVATEFERRQDADELILCRRYYAKSYLVDTTPGTTSPDNGKVAFYTAGTAGETGPFVSFQVAMRAVPTMTFYSPATGASGKIRNVSGAADETSTGPNTTGDSSFAGTSGSRVTANIYNYHYTAEAEL